MKIAVAAYPIEWHNRWNDYVGKLRLWVRTAAEGGAELLVFPEFALIELASLAEAENARDPARAAEALSARIKDVDALHSSLAREFGAHICAASGPLKDAEGRIVNRARLFAPDGGRAFQDKLAPGAEERAAWGTTPGATARVFETALGRIGVLLGADVSDPEIAAAMTQAGAALLLAPVQASTPESAADLRAAAQARARENGRPVALAMALAAAAQAPSLGTSVGAAAVLLPDGEQALAEGKMNAPGWVQAEAALAASPAPSPGGGAWAVEVTPFAAPPGEG